MCRISLSPLETLQVTSFAPLQERELGITQSTAGWPVTAGTESSTRLATPGHTWVPPCPRQDQPVGANPSSLSHLSTLPWSPGAVRQSVPAVHSPLSPSLHSAKEHRMCCQPALGLRDSPSHSPHCLRGPASWTRRVNTRRAGQLYATSEFLIFSKCFTLIR